MPFSDPLADGPTIQRSTFEALQAGMTLAGTLELIARARLCAPGRGFQLSQPDSPIWCRTIPAARRTTSGSAGLLLTDLPAGSDPAVESAVQASPLDLIRLVAPTTRADRLAAAVSGAQGFVYLVARLGVTGATPRWRGASATPSPSSAGPPACPSPWASGSARRSRRRTSRGWPTASWWGAPRRVLGREGVVGVRRLPRVASPGARSDGGASMTVDLQRLIDRYAKVLWIGGLLTALPRMATDLRWLLQPITTVS